MFFAKSHHLMRRAAAAVVSAAVALLSMPALAADAIAVPSVSAETADTTVTLSWSSIDGATGYNIYADGAADAAFTPSVDQSAASHVTLGSSGKTTSFELEGLAYGSTHTYAVEAVTAAGKSEKSAEVSVTLLPQVTGAAATAGNAAAKISWDALSGVDSYEVDYGTASGNYDDAVDTVPGSSTDFILTGLSNGTTYYVKVTAYDADYNSSSSEELTVTPVAASYDVSSAAVTGYTISTDHSGTNVSGTDDQYILMDITFDRAVAFADKDAFVKELSAVYAGTDLEATTYADEQSISADGKTLHLKLHFPFAGYAQTLHVAAANLSGAFFTGLVDAATNQPVAFAPIDAIVNNGLDFTTVSQTVGTSSTAASVTKSVTRLASATRGMYHVVVLKNGQPVGAADSYGANITSHFHLYIDNGSTSAYTAGNVATNVAAAINSKFGTDYTATADGDSFTVTANAAADGDVLDVLFVAYPRSADSGADTGALKSAISRVEAAGLTGADDQLAIAKSIAASGYYLQSEVDAQAAALTALLSDTPSTDSASPSSADTSSASGTSSAASVSASSAAASETDTTSSSANPETGSSVNTAPVAVAVSAAALAAVCVLTLRRKRRRL